MPAGLVSDLRRLGVGDGDVLMVHASMRRVGGSAADLIDAIDHVLGVNGTWMMTLGALDEWSWVNERPESERAALLEASPVFDALTAPAESEIGVLAEVFRQTSGTHVSDHPEGRFGARGALATELTRDVPWDDYYGAGSPLERFVAADGRVLRLGADDDTTTVIHYAEYLAPLVGKRRVRRHRRVAGERGPEVRVVDTLDDSDGIAEYERVVGDEFAAILRELRGEDLVTRGAVGGADAELIDARQLVDFAVNWMVAHAARHHRP